MNAVQTAELRQALGLEDVELTDDELQKLYEMNQSGLKAHGVDPATREQAAASGAGYLIVAAALGLSESMHVSLIERSDGKGWKAKTNLQLVSLYDCYSETADPIAVLKSSLQCQAGFAGEMFKGVGHPSSSLPMRVKSAIYASYLDHVYHMPLNTYFNRTIDLGQGILAFNEVTFDALYARLLSKGAIDCKLDGTLLANVRPAVLGQIFGSIQ